MRNRDDPLDRRGHRKVGSYLFNYTWSLLDKKRRSPEDDDEMLHAAHASRFHWGRAGTLVNLTIGEWQISRVYAVLLRPEPASYHAERALTLAQRGRAGAFYLAYGYEALARAAAVAGKRRQQVLYRRKAERLAKKIRDSDDRRMLLEDLATIH